MDQKANAKMITRLMFRLLPAQVLLMSVSAVNGIVSSFFASNYVGVDAMSAVGLYGPVTLLLSALSTMVIAGSAIMCGKAIGQNDQVKLQRTFSLNLIITIIIGAVFTLSFLISGFFDLTGIITNDEAVRPLFNHYLIGQAIGVIPLLLGSQFPAYLIMENRNKRTFAAGLVYAGCNIVLNVLFVKVMHLEAFGLALASSLGLWVFLAVEAEYFLTGKSHLRFSPRRIAWKDSIEIVKIGFPGAACTAYQTLRGMIVNWLLTVYVGSVAISAFTAANNTLALFWAIPNGMLAVTRVLISVSVGEEDRQTLSDITRVMFRWYLPLQCVVSALLILFAVPLTEIYYRDPSAPVFMMTVWGFRILPLCMPFAVICMHFVCYGQTTGKQFFVHALAVIDGVICVSGFTALLIKSLGMESVYVANVLNGIVTVLFIICYAWIRNKRFPCNMEQLMVVPDDFGASEEERMDFTVKSIEEVVTIAERVQKFCLSRGIDSKRSYLAGLALEEMAGNVALHGFAEDNKKHNIDVRVVQKEDDVILRIKDDCKPFDPAEWQKLAEDVDPVKNIGIRMVFRIAKDVQYQNVMGLNVLTIRI